MRVHPYSVPVSKLYCLFFKQVRSFVIFIYGLRYTVKNCNAYPSPRYLTVDDAGFELERFKLTEL